MTLQLTSEQVWIELNKQLFAVLGMVTLKGEARTAGVVYTVHDHKIYLSTGNDSWKVRHIQRNPHVSLTVPIAKRIPIMPWIKIPAATITFSGQARVFDAAGASHDILQALFRGLESDTDQLETISIVEITPIGDFVTYGVGVSLRQMRFPHKARGRASTV
ncbi:MAG: pyridoxamine 5'-phosphate oxidase family protein [Chloroflexi bacterium]|nr:pyridoxamine 5'-phosphate oxidase family protein [Chloroflexota bacterium]